ncbi:hypothetical protein GWI33_009721 [Rhynchophorus ferrugineus]|uniref:Uncharacterized protein n=1 Tax=Rhynchophorus ferrugineus TaxID=354439 RepID=A0A834IA74_RHYFE|nr:hypothetical protein GWI33_009721 [Rhynchophorus ferrugineus]
MVECSLSMREVPESNPGASNFIFQVSFSYVSSSSFRILDLALASGGVAQMVERSLCTREVPGSIPGASNLYFLYELHICAQFLFSSLRCSFVIAIGGVVHTVEHSFSMWELPESIPSASNFSFFIQISCLFCIQYLIFQF